MHFMNQWDIEEAVRRHSRHPVLGKATRFLQAFAEEVNSHSDGWSHWGPPVKAADRLMTLIESGQGTDADFRKTLSPIRIFYTRRGNAAGMAFPTIG